jgi:PAS domain S-box-containing protein
MLAHFREQWSRWMHPPAPVNDPDREHYRIISEMASDYTVYCTFQQDGSDLRQWVIGPHEAITSYTIEESSGPNGDHFWHPDDKARQQADRERVKAGEEFTAEYRLVRKDGELRWVSLTRRPVWDEAHTRVIGFFAVVTDITARKDADEQRLKFTLQREQLSILSAFVHAISHDFRNRLSILESSRYLISRKIDAVSREQVQPQLAIIANTTKQMNEQIANMIELIRLDDFNPEAFDLNSLLQNAAHARLRDAQARQVEMRLEPDPRAGQIIADARQMERALDHLVNNALIYTDQGGRVTIRSRRTVDRVTITVEDTGSGIPADKLAQVFEPFFKVNNARTVGIGGVGVGLTLVKLIADAHRGEVRVESEEGRGSRFDLILPI